MSRIGRKPIPVPAGVEVSIDGAVITVKGKNGTLTQSVSPDMAVIQEGGELIVKRPSESKAHKSLHGLTRSLVGNMVTGVSEGFRKELEIQGVGYRAQKQGKELVLNLGYSHSVTFTETDDLSIEVPSPTRIIVSGPSKQKVGQLAAEIRGMRPPEPYKGKGIRYLGEFIIRKEGKAGKGRQ